MLKSDFIIRKSGVREGYYYIDFDGEYEPDKIQEITGIDANQIVEISKANGGEYSEQFNVYYFVSKADVEKVIRELMVQLKPSKKVKNVELTLEEIELIRKALINEDSNIIFTKTKIRESIFDKLNR